MKRIPSAYTKIDWFEARERRPEDYGGPDNYRPYSWAYKVGATDKDLAASTEAEREMALEFLLLEMGDAEVDYWEKLADIENDEII